MLPTLRINQYVTTDNTARRRARVRIGDIVVFHPPKGADVGSLSCGVPSQGAGRRQPCGVASPGRSPQDFIKRVVGLPGDRIALIAGHVIRNGRRAKEPFTAPRSTPGDGCTFPQAITVPAGQFYALGDNRPQSADSRYWGPVKLSWIIGVVVR